MPRELSAPVLFALPGAAFSDMVMLRVLVLGSPVGRSFLRLQQLSSVPSPVDPKSTVAFSLG
jgi:hypothetical protein